MLNRYFELATAAILDEGGTVVQFVGDALMALFNAPARQPDHPLRAARAALAMQAAVEGWPPRRPGWPRFRVGINTGPALVGNIGSAAFRNFNAMGDAVNVAARLETAAAGAGRDRPRHPRVRRSPRESPAPSAPSRSRASATPSPAGSSKASRTTPPPGPAPPGRPRQGPDAPADRRRGRLALDPAASHLM